MTRRPGLSESDARRALLLRVFETPAVLEPWTQADADWAGREAARSVGEAASAEALIAARARLGVERLLQRAPGLSGVLAASGWPRALSLGLVLIALALGIATDAVGAAGRINLLAPPLLGLLAWNLGVYAALAGSALRPGARVPGPLRGALARAAAWLASRGVGQAGLPRAGVGAFAADWLAASRGLYAARSAALLHAGAAAFALGLLGSLYLRGIAFEYRAGWDSTFLSPAAVQGLLSFVLGPAARLSGNALPDVEHISRLRFASGAGENAAPWIHLFAITVVLAVLLPRALLAAWAAWRARRLAADVALPLGDAYFERLVRGLRGAAVRVLVRPYGVRLAAERRDELARALERELGARVEWQLAPAVVLGEEDAVADTPLAPGTLVVALFALAATPERESHGAFLEALRRATGAPVRVLIDESGWRERFGASAERRLAERRELWRRFAREAEAEAVWFADLAARAAAPSA